MPVPLSYHIMTRHLAVLSLLLAVAGSLFAADPTPARTKTAVFAGGCFWCMQSPFDHAKGVVKTVVGYTGGSKEDANYEKVSSETTEHREALQVTYDPAQISYEQLIDLYWRQINPTQTDGQFHDIGESYRTAIYYSDEAEKKIAESAKEKLAKSRKFDKPIATEILPAKPFYPAEEYHQKYYEKNPSAYQIYHIGSGRVIYLKKNWSDEKK